MKDDALRAEAEAEVDLIRDSFSSFARGSRVERSAVYAEYLRRGGAYPEKRFWSMSKRCANFVDGADSNDSTIIIK